MIAGRAGGLNLKWEDAMRTLRASALFLAIVSLVPWAVGACARSTRPVQPRPPPAISEGLASAVEWRFRGLAGLEEAFVEAKKTGRNILVGVSGGPG